MDNILNFEIGKYSPKLEKLQDYEKSFKVLNEILIEAKDSDSRRDNNNNIIAFIGERGGGKTSCMISFENILLETIKSPNSDISKKIFETISNDSLKCEITNYSYESLDIIDPSFFTEKSNILEIILATLFKNFQEKSSQNNNMDSQRNLSKIFKKVYQNISIINNQYDFDGENYERLQDLAATITLKNDIKDLIKYYLEFMNSNSINNKLIIKIDDIDLNIKYSYEMVEQIRKYLIQDNIIILMAVKLDQLEQIIKNNFIKNFNLKIENIDSNCEQMTYRYLEKLIPQSRRMYLIDLEKESKNIILKANNNENNLETYVRQLIFNKIKILFTNDKTKNNPIVPNNLRSLINFINTFINLVDIENIEKINTDGLSEEEKRKKEEEKRKKEEEKRILFKKNIVAFDDYFFNTWIDNNLNVENKKIIKELHSKSVGAKNKYITTKILNKLKEFNSDAEYDKLTKINKYDFTSTNVSLGDVLENLNNLKRLVVDDEHENFITAIKILYNRYIYEYYLNYEKLDEENPETLDYTDFEIFLGGEVIISKNLLYNPDKLSEVKTKKFYDELKEVFENKDSFIEEIKNLKLEDNIEEIKKKLKKIQALILCTYFFKDVHAPRKRVNSSTLDNKIIGSGREEAFYQGTYDLNNKNIESIEFDICAPFFFNLSEYRLLNRYVYKDTSFYELIKEINVTIENSNLDPLKINPFTDDKQKPFSKLHLRSIEVIEKVFESLKFKSSSDHFEVIKSFYHELKKFELKSDIDIKSKKNNYKFFENINPFNEEEEEFNEILFSKEEINYSIERDLEAIEKEMYNKKTYSELGNIIINQGLKEKFKEFFKKKNQKKYITDNIKKFIKNIRLELDTSKND